MSRNKAIDVLGLGAVAVDDFIHVERYPPPDEKARVLGRERQCGGLTAIALIAAARLGARCTYAGVLGHDELSRFVLECMEHEKIDVSPVKRTAAARPIYSNIVVDRRRGTRNIFFDVERFVGANPQAPAALIESCRVLFVDHLGLLGMIRAARLARRAGIPVVADFESQSGAGFPELLALTNHLVLSRGFAMALTGKESPEKAVRALAGPRHEAVVVTCGAEGCWFWSKELSAPGYMNAFKVKAVDTTGCGDVFHGAYAFALARNLPLPERLRLASAAAALKASGNGGPAAIPPLPKVQKFLKYELNHQPR
jgi:ribokinase